MYLSKKKRCETKMANGKKIPNVKVEIKKIENLKEEIKTRFNLGKEGLAFKIIKHNSPYRFTYEKIDGNFFENTTKLLKGANLQPFIKRLRK